MSNSFFAQALMKRRAKIIYDAMNLYNAFAVIGREADLAIAYDLGDASSFDPGVSTELINDLSDNNDGAVMGISSGNNTADPPYNIDAAGGLSLGEYIGDILEGDCCRMTSTPAFFDTLHKAGAQYCIVFAGRAPTGDLGTNFMLTNINSSVNHGISLGGDTTDLTVVIRKGSGDAGLFATDGGFTAGEEFLLFVNIDEAGGSSASFFRKNRASMQVGGSDTFDAAYTSPSSSSASYNMFFFNRTVTQNVGWHDGTRFYFGGFVNGNLSVSECNTLFDILGPARLGL